MINLKKKASLLRILKNGFCNKLGCQNTAGKCGYCSFDCKEQDNFWILYIDK